MRAAHTSSLVAFVALLTSQFTSAQTYTKCDPTQQSCQPNPALGTSKSVDFTSGAAASDFEASGPISYDSNGATFTISKSGDSPMLKSNWYFMFGKVDVVMKSAPGTGIVSSIVLQSDDLDEIDWEALGSDPTHIQTNYFRKHQNPDNGKVTNSEDPTSTTDYNTYTVDWSKDQIVWQLNGNTVRSLSYGASNGQYYPQTPMQVRLGAWAGGDTSGNQPGTVSWAGGATDFTQGPFKMYIKSVKVQDYSTGQSYEYSGTDGSWTAVKSNGGSINGGSTQASSSVSSNAGTTTTNGISEPFAGTHAEPSQTFTKPSVYPWVSQPQSSDGTSSSDGAAHPIMPASSATATALAGPSGPSAPSASAGSQVGGSPAAAATGVPSSPSRAGGYDGGAAAGGAGGSAYAPTSAVANTAPAFSTSVSGGSTPAPRPATSTPVTPYRGAAGKVEVAVSVALAGMVGSVVLALL